MTFEEKTTQQIVTSFMGQTFSSGEDVEKWLTNTISQALKEQKEEIKNWCDKRMELYHEMYGTDKHDFPLEELKDYLSK